MDDLKYVLVTAARNEERYIELTIRSVISQTVKPAKWVIVSDGSTDLTDEIVKKYSAIEKFIQLIRVDDSEKRNFRSQVFAINTGYVHLAGEKFQYIGNLDADISFGARYFQILLGKMVENSDLGLCGGTIYERNKGVFAPRKFNSPKCVPHAVQFFRRECFEQIGGYLPLKYGGPDTHAEVFARMKGWRVELLGELPAYHHRATSSYEGFVRAAFRQGKMDYSLGNHPLFEFFKWVNRIREKPYFLHTLIHMMGYVSGFWEKEERLVSKDFVRYLHKEQLKRLRNLLN
jgi:poly-beta-1,6-N-acetyl-D-glucosamine synthase